MVSDILIFSFTNATIPVWHALAQIVINALVVPRVPLWCLVYVLAVMHYYPFMGQFANTISHHPFIIKGPREVGKSITNFIVLLYLTLRVYAVSV
jgi:hypothetical protein